MGSRIHWELCRKYGIECTEKWFNHIPSSVCSTKNKQVEIYWDQKIEVGKGLEHNKPDLVVVDKTNKKWIIVDFSVPFLPPPFSIYGGPKKFKINYLS